jgi:cytochrome c oxidase subunit IV
MSDPVKSTKLYWGVFFALIVLTALTVTQARLMNLDHTTNRIIGVIIACTKGTLVALFFMHLKYEKRYFYPVVIFPLVLLLVIIFANFPDVAFGEHTAPGVELKPAGQAGGH